MTRTQLFVSSVMGLVGLVFLAGNLQAQEYVVDDTLIDQYLAAKTDLERDALLAKMEKQLANQVQPSPVVITKSGSGGLSNALTGAINGKAPGATSGSGSKGMTRGQKRYSRSGTGGGTKSGFDFGKALADLWKQIVDGAMWLFGMDPSAENQHKVEAAAAGYDAAMTKNEEFGGTVTFSENGTPNGFTPDAGVLPAGALDARSPLNNAVGTPVLGPNGELLGFDRDGDGKSDFTLNEKGEYVYNGGTNGDAYEDGSKYTEPGYTPGALPGLESLGKDASGNLSPLMPADLARGTGGRSGGTGDRGALGETGAGPEVGGAVAATLAGGGFGGSGSLPPAQGSSYGKASVVGGPVGGGGGGESKGKAEDSSKNPLRPGDDTRRNKKDGKGAGSAMPPKPGTKDPTRRMPPAVVRGRLVLLRLRAERAVRPSPARPGVTLPPTTDQIAAALGKEIRRVDRRIARWRTGKADRKRRNPVERARDATGKIDFTKVAVWVVEGDTWREGREPVRYRLSLGPDVNHLTFTPQQGGLIVIRGYKGDLDRLLARIEQREAAKPNPRKIVGEVETLKVVNVLVTAGPPAD